MAGDVAPPASVHRRRARRGAGHVLREEIVAAAHRLLECAGRADDVSMRAVAESVGVTTPSIYLHFSDKQHLMLAVVEDAFAELYREMRRRISAAPRPADRLLACGRAYVAFALNHPEQYRLALMSPTRPETSEAPKAVSAVLKILKPSVVDYLDSQSLPHEASTQLALELFAMAHGVASLLIVTPELQADGNNLSFVDRALCATLHGTDHTHAQAPDPSRDANAG